MLLPARHLAPRLVATEQIPPVKSRYCFRPLLSAAGSSALPFSFGEAGGGSALRGIDPGSLKSSNGFVSDGFGEASREINAWATPCNDFGSSLKAT